MATINDSPQNKFKKRQFYLLFIYAFLFAFSFAFLFALTAESAMTRHWCVKYYSSSGGNARAMDIDTDGAGGGLFVTGAHDGKIWIAKIRSIPPTGAGTCPADMGLIAWQREPADGIGYGIRFADGYVYVVGSRSGDGACWVDKMNALTGISLSGWPKTYTNCYAGDPVCDVTCGEGARASIDVDSGGNIYVSGFPLSGASVTDDFRLLKLDPNGSQQWLLDYNSGGTDVIQDMTLDSQGRPYMVGQASNYTSVRVLRTNPDGGSWNWTSNIQWGSFTSASFDRQGVEMYGDNVYVMGQYQDSTGRGLFVYGWNALSGLLNFNWAYNSIYMGGYFRDLAVGPSVCNGSLFATGSPGGCAWLARFNSQGYFLDRAFDTTAERGEAVAVDGQFVYVAGMGTTGGIWIAKFFVDCDVPPPDPPEPTPPPDQTPLGQTDCKAYNYPNPKHSGQSTTIHWELPRAVDTDLKIVDLLGNTVMEWHFKEGRRGGWSGTNEIQWDGRNSDGKMVHQGMYHVILETRGGVCKKTFQMGVIP